jgi:hypothetical protein
VRLPSDGLIAYLYRIFNRHDQQPSTFKEKQNGFRISITTSWNIPSVVALMQLLIRNNLTATAGGGQANALQLGRRD